MTIEAQIAAYLDGELDQRSADEVEVALTDPAIAVLLSEELMVRELLAAMPPDAPPSELIARLEDSLGVRRGVLDPVRSQLRAAVSESRWVRRGPALGFKALAAARVGVNGARVAASGVSTMRSSLDLISDIPRPRFASSRPKPLWRRAASFVWRSRK